MRSFFEVLNHPIDAFRNKNKTVTGLLVAITILINTVFEPLLAYFTGIQHPVSDIYLILRTTLLGCISYLGVCIVFWLICKCFGSKTPLSTYFQTWGLTFFPTLLCSLAIAFSETFFYIFWNNSIWGMLLSIIFVGILIWKAILYGIFLREVADLKGGRMIGAFIVIGIMILALALLNGYVGLKTPIL